MCQLTSAGCNSRRQRMRSLLDEQHLDVVVFTDPRDIYYFTGARLPRDLPTALFLPVSGQDLLVAPEGEDLVGADQYVVYSWNQRGTKDPEPVEQFISAAHGAAMASGARRVGVQGESLPWRLAELLRQDAGRGELVAIDRHLADLQSRKDPDEVAMLRASIHANLGAYAAVQAAIAPGANELGVLAAGYRGAMTTAGEKVLHDGDYRCGEYNGPARDRAIKSGELYIVDAWTCRRGYWSDLARTFLVGTAATDIQQGLFEHIASVQKKAGALLRPSVNGREIYCAMDELIREHPMLADEGLVHHGGHAIGLRAHEMPDINRDRGGILTAGNVICLEPGGYLPAARYGVRLEHTYLITESGAENLCPDELVLKCCHGEEQL